MVQLFLDPTLVVSILHLCIYFLSQRPLFMRKLKKFLLFFALLPFLILYFFFQSFNSVVQVLNLKIFVVYASLSPLVLIQCLPIGLVLLTYVLILLFSHFNFLVHLFYLIFEVVLPVYCLIIIRILSFIDELLDLSLQFFIFCLYLSILLFYFSVVIYLCQQVGVIKLQLTIFAIQICFLLLIDKSLASLCLLVDAAFFIMMVHLHIAIFDFLYLLIQFFDALIQSQYFAILFSQFLFQSFDFTLFFRESQFEKLELLLAEEDVIFKMK